MESRRRCSLGRDLPVLLLLAVLAVVQRAEAATLLPRAGCSASINDDSSFPDPQPLFLVPGGSADAKGFWQPSAATGLLTLQAGETILLACTGKNNVITVLNISEAIATCVSGTTFSVGGQAYQLRDLSCRSLPASTQRDTLTTCGDCDEVFSLLQIGFQVSGTFVKLVDVCFDDTRLATVYVKETIVAGIGGYQSGFPRPSWRQGDFFGLIEVNTAYTQNKQRQTVAQLLGSTELANMYVVPDTNFYMSRGHLSAKADWVFGSQQSATFWFLNAAPQWEVFNGGNWERTESSVRYYAREKGVDLTVYTGTYGVATLPDACGVQTELYLVVDGDYRAIPVPKLFWKLVIDPANDAGVAVVGVNNPYVSSPGGDYYLCPDVCGKLSWLTIDANNQERGFSYCCEVSEFQKAINVLHEINVSSLPQL